MAPPAAGSFFRDNSRWLAAGVLLTFASSFGQTFFIALFAEPLRAETGLSHGAWGSLYAAATLASAVAIGWLGHLADIRPVRLPALGVIAALALAALTMSLVSSVWMLALAVFVLRFAGQGMAGHVAATAAARWFSANRGRAIAISAVGHPLGEAVLPGIAVALMLLLGWRSTWLAMALVLAFAIGPVLAWLLAKERTPKSASSVADDGAMPGIDGRHWRRGEVLRHPFFWALLPGFMASPFIGTAVFFQSVPLAAAKAWTLELYAAAFPAYALGSTIAAYGAGVLVDRYGSARLLPYVLLPMAVALLIGAAPGPALMVIPFLGLFGLSAGALFTVMSALWAELYGTRHLGAVRGMVSAVLVFATALGPGLTGLLLDAGVGIERQLAAMAVATIVLAGSFALVSRALARPMASPVGSD